MIEEIESKTTLSRGRDKSHIDVARRLHMFKRGHRGSEGRNMDNVTFT